MDITMQKLNLNSDESDYEDNTPSKVVQEGLNAMSRESELETQIITM